jgi:hypothetical protein
MEQGIFDFDTSSTEIRMPVEFAHAVGKLTIKYPLAISTKSIRKGSDKYLEIDGPEVSYDKEKIELPEAATFSKIEPLRAYDAAGKQLERADYVKGYFKNNSTWRELGFWGNVAEVRMDSVGKWAEIDVDYDLGPAPKLPASAQGMTPPLEERLKVAESGKVTKTIKVEARPHVEQSGDPHEVIARVFKGDADGVRELLDAGASVDSREASTGSTALIAAVRGGYRDLAMMLIKRGADVNIRDNNGGTALIFAAEKCDWTPVVRELLKRGAQTAPKTKGGANALQFAEWAKCSANAALIRGK